MSNRAIIDAVKAMSGANNPAASLHIGTVTAVDEETYTCACRLETGGGVAMPGIKLMPNPDDGVVGFPAIDSQVLIIMQSPGDPYVIMTTEPDKLDGIANKEIYLHVDKSTVQLTPDKIVLNDGSYGGLVKVEALVERLNKIEEDINKLKKAFKDWTVKPQDGGAALREKVAGIAAGAAIPGSWAADTLVTTTVGQVENLNVLHGKD
ncbi:MAG: hypothetical protein EOP56_08255 [Sphingobacteriales bacterium]|nr:MAG: hypothetical protein EOP56_08255 [Sphingobacteriales bacterium]